MRKAILAVATGALVLGGSLVVLAQDGATGDTDRPAKGAVVEVLDELVSEGTLTQEQADAVIAALEVKRDEVRAEHEAVRQQLEEFWADDELTQEEIDQLPGWHRLSRASDMLEDGVITRDELRDLRPLRHLRNR